MKKCRECGNNIPRRITVNGTRINLQCRTICLECLPFKHRRPPLLPEKRRLRQCAWLKQDYKAFKEAYGTDLVTARRNYRKRLVYAQIGGHCQICGYSRCLRNLGFHHIQKKSLNVDGRTFQFAYQRVIDELKKCVAVCNRCHGEIHDGLITPNVIKMNKQLVKGIANITREMWIDRHAIIDYLQGQNDSHRGR